MNSKILSSSPNFLPLILISDGSNFELQPSCSDLIKDQVGNIGFAFVSGWLVEPRPLLRLLTASLIGQVDDALLPPG